MKAQLKIKNSPANDTMGSSKAIIIKVLHDLLKINMNRVEGYKNASYDTHDPGLKALFLNMVDQSKKNIAAITKEIVNHNGNSELKATQTNKISEVWQNLKARFSSKSIKDVLTLCESKETEALRIYRKARVKGFSIQLTDLIEKQEQLLKSSHEVIKVYRQAYSKVDRLYS